MAQAKTRPSRKRSKVSSKSKKASRGRTSPNGVARARHAAGDAVGRAKVPLIAGGAAIAGAAGGLAVGVRRGRSSSRGAKAAKQLGTLGSQIGSLANELRQARENDVHRSPVEVVLEGLTARRARR
jgi:hypothetical protein